MADKINMEEGIGSNSDARLHQPASLAQRFQRTVMANLLVILTVAGVTMGVCIGIGVRNMQLTPAQVIYVGFPGELLIRMLRLIIIPLVVCSLVTGAASIDPKALGKLGGWAMLYFLATTVIASVIGLALASVVSPGSVTAGIKPPLDEDFPQAREAVDSFLDLVRNIFPSNLVSAAFQSYATSYKLITTNGTDGVSTTEKVPFGTEQDSVNILGLLVFAMAFGVALRNLGEKGKVLIEFFSQFNEATMHLVSWVMWYAPVGIMFLVAGKILEMGDVGMLFASMGKYIACCIVGLAIQGLLVVPGIYFIFTRKNPYTFMWGIFTALATAFGTASSSATLPMMIKCVEEKNGVSKHVSRFVLPIGATINMDGAALVQCTATVFIAQLNGISLGFTQVVTILVMAAASSVGAAGIPAGHVLTLAMILEAIGLPTEDISLILAVDWIVDRFNTMVNVEGDAFGAGLLQHFVDRTSQREEELVLREVVEEKLPDSPLVQIELGSEGDALAQPSLTT